MSRTSECCCHHVGCACQGLKPMGEAGDRCGETQFLGDHLCSGFSPALRKVNKLQTVNLSDTHKKQTRCLCCLTRSVWAECGHAARDPAWPRPGLWPAFAGDPPQVLTSPDSSSALSHRAHRTPRLCSCPALLGGVLQSSETPVTLAQLQSQPPSLLSFADLPNLGDRHQTMPRGPGLQPLLSLVQERPPRVWSPSQKTPVIARGCGARQGVLALMSSRL